jgi:hypothetical protein
MSAIINDVARGVQRVLGTTNDRLGLAIMEGLILRIFDQFTDQMLYEAICCNTNLWGQNWGEFEKYREQVMMIVQDPKYNQYGSLLTVENILEWLRNKDGKPSFASIIVNTPGGPAWLDTQIQSLMSNATKKIEVKVNGGADPAAN